MKMSRVDANELFDIYLEMTSTEVVGPAIQTTGDLGTPNDDTYARGDTRVPKGTKKKKKDKFPINRRNLSFGDTFLYQTPEVKSITNKIINS